MVTPHDILCINGASAALMLSPLPFFGPVGAVRIGRIDGELVVNPTLQQNWEETTLDLIVVGTKDGLTMVEAGADEVPEDELLEALELAHGEIRKLCEAQEELRRQAGKPKWLDMDAHRASSRPQHGHTIWERIQQRRPPRGGRRRRGARRASSPASSRWTRPRTTSSARCRCARASPMLLEKQRLVAVEGPVREQFENDLRALTDAEQDSKELKSAKRHLLFDRIVETVELPFPVGPATADGEPGGQGLAHEELRQEGRRGDLQGPRPQEDRGRQAPPRRPRHRGDPPDRVSRSASARARTAPASSRAARRRSCRC